MVDKISDAIRRADLPTICQPRQGDCESVAIALHRVFSADEFVCIYDPMVRDAPVHATVRINGVLYDGTGKTTKDSLLDYISYLKVSDFPDTVQTVEEMNAYINTHGYHEYTIENGLDILNYKTRVVDKVTAALKKTRN